MQFVLIIFLFFSLIVEGKDFTEVSFDLEYKFSIYGNTTKLKFIVVLPNSMPKVQDINGIDFSIEPSRIIENDGKNYAEFIIENPQDGLEIKITVNAVLYEWNLDSALTINIESFPDEDTEQFLLPEESVESASHTHPRR